MKVFCCKNQEPYGGGLILVIANTIEEAFLTVAIDENYAYIFDWVNDKGDWCKPDGNIDHCISHTYPFKSWFAVEHLSTDLTKPKIIIENHYTE